MSTGEDRELDSDGELQLAGQLENYLESLRSGRHCTPAGSEELDGLLPVIDDLHQLASLISSAAELSAAGEVASDVRFAETKLGKYQLERPLGRGGQSATMLAMDHDLHRRVVLKVYHSMSTPEHQQVVLNEGRMLARVKSPYVAQCLGADRHQNVPFLVLEYVSGAHLGDFQAQTRLAPPQVLELMDKVAEGLAAIHRCGLLHRDLKPANILVDEHGIPKIVDLGLARSQYSEPSRQVSGTPAYMSPEQAHGESERMDVRSDIFGLGAVLYELLTGQPPYRAASRAETLRLARDAHVLPPNQLRQDIPAALNDLCMRCLARHPIDRFPTVADLQAAIRRLKRGSHVVWRYLPVAAVATMVLAIPLTLALITANRDVAGEPQRVYSARALNLAAIPREAVRFFAIDGRLRRDFDLQVKVLGAITDAEGVVELSAGDEVYLQIEPARNCYVTILSYGPDPPVQLFPKYPLEQSHAEAIFRGGVSRVIPEQPVDPDAEFVPIKAKVSTGKEAICIVASTQPVMLAEDTDSDPVLVFEDPAQRARMNSRLRSLIRDPETTGNSVSQVLIPFQVRPAH